MALRPDNGRSLDRTVLLFLFGLLLFFSPLTSWWAGAAVVWYLPYLLWLALIGVIAWAAYRSQHDL